MVLLSVQVVNAKTLKKSLLFLYLCTRTSPNPPLPHSKKYHKYITNIPQKYYKM